MKINYLCHLAIALAMITMSSVPTRAADAVESSGTTVVHLSHYSDDLHAAFMALKLAGAMRDAGQTVTLFVDLEGVRVADQRQPSDLRWGHSKPLSEHYDAFVKSGGQVVVCPHCAKAAGLTSANLRPGARIGSEEEVAAAIASADRVLDY